MRKFPVSTVTVTLLYMYNYSVHKDWKRGAFQTPIAADGNDSMVGVSRIFFDGSLNSSQLDLDEQHVLNLSTGQVGFLAY